MGDEEAKSITDEQRAGVLIALFEMLRAHGVDIKDGTEIFRHRFVGEVGAVTIDFEIGQGLADWAIETSRYLLEKVLNSVNESLKAKGESEDSLETQFAEDEYNDYAALLAYFLMQGMSGKLRDAFYELGLESETVFEGFVVNVIKEHPTFTNLFHIHLPNISEDVKALSKSMATARKQFLTAQISSFKHKPKLERLPTLYPMLLKVWQSVKKIYDQNGESETWRDMVKAKYPEITFDDDLLTRITGQLENLPEDVQAKLADTDGDHTPSTIALEHAARMCGAAPYQYGTRYLFKLKSDKGKTELTETE
jgi:hypothetical protein